MSIKNFTVTAKSITGRYKGLSDYCVYLVNSNHKNHSKTHIEPIYGNINTFIKNVMGEVTELDLKNKKNKGGRPVESYVQSYNFILPKNTIRPSKKQWNAISKDIIDTISKEIDIDKKTLKNLTFINLHDQDNPHVNFVISKVINGSRCRKIDQKTLLSKVKTQFNNSVFKHCNYDYKAYKPTNTEVGRRTDKWLHTLKLLTKAKKQFESLADYIDDNNQKRIQSTENRIIKTFQGIDYSEAEKALNDIKTTKNDDFNDSVERILKKLRI